MNIKTLTKRIDREIQPKEIGATYISIMRDTKPAEISWAGLRKTTIDELFAIQSILSMGVPDDFDFDLTFENSDFSMQLLYEDGMNSGGGKALPVKLGDNLAGDLSKINWDDERAYFLNMSDAFSNF